MLQAQAQNRVELDNLTWFTAGSGNGLPPGTYTKPGSPSETLVSTIPSGGPPAVFCNPVFQGQNNNGQTILETTGKGFFETLNDYGGTYTFTRKYLVTPGKSTYMKVRMASASIPTLLVSSMTATIDGRSLGRADRYNTSWNNQVFLEGSQLWTPTKSLVDFVISVTAPGGCHADELILYVDQFYQDPSTISAVDDAGATLNSNGGQAVANVLANDSLNGSTPSPSTVNLTQLSSTNPKLTLNTSTGAVDVAASTLPGSYTLVYQICEKANPANCSQATVTVKVTLAPTALIIKKALGGGGRLNPADQFTVQLSHYGTLMNNTANSTTKGSGSTVEAGSGVTNAVVVAATALYTLGEVMAPGSVSSLSKYSSSVRCEAFGVGGTDLSYVRTLSDTLTMKAGDTGTCTITNSSPIATLTVKQVIAAGSGQPPFTFNYTVGNGWGVAPITNPAVGMPGVASDTRNLTAAGTDTPIGVTLPVGWRMVPEASSCVDSNGASTGNASTSFGTSAANILTVPAANVRSGSALVCTVTLSLSKPAATLSVRHMVLPPVPVNLKPPFTFSYTGTNGWTAPALTVAALNQYFSTAAVTLASANTATTLSTSLPEPRWQVVGFTCADTSAGASGNPVGTLVSSSSTSVTIPAAYVVPGATLRCSMLMGHLTP